MLLVVAAISLIAYDMYHQKELAKAQQPNYDYYSPVAWTNDCVSIAPWLDSNDPAYAGFGVKSEQVSFTINYDGHEKTEYIFYVDTIRFENAIYHVKTGLVNAVIDDHGNEGQLINPMPYLTRAQELMTGVKVVHATYYADWHPQKGWLYNHECTLEK